MFFYKLIVGRLKEHLPIGLWSKIERRYVMAAKIISTILEQDKVCKSCVRYRSPHASKDEVTTSLYLQNDAYEKLGSPKKIQVTVGKSS